MARCPKLECSNSSFLGNSYVCSCTGAELDDLKINHLCNPDSGYEYENCPIYKDS